MSQYKFILTEKAGKVAIITLNRPEALNAWHQPMRDEFEDALRKAAADEQAAAIVITGAGDRAFCAGQDLAETEKFLGGEEAKNWSGSWRRLYSCIRDIEKPIIGALNGVAAGSAFQVAMLTDVRVGHEGSRMGQPEINSGIPSSLGPWLMVDRIGLSRTIELTLSGRMMDGKECYAVGLIHHLTTPENVRKLAVEIATNLAEKPQGAMKENKRHFRNMTEESFQKALTLGSAMQERAFGSGEPQFWMKKFFEQRAKAKKR